MSYQRRVCNYRDSGLVQTPLCDLRKQKQAPLILPILKTVDKMVVYDRDTKFLSGYSDKNKPGDVKQVKEGLHQLLRHAWRESTADGEAVHLQEQQVD